MTNKDGKYLLTRKDIQLRFIDSWRFMVSSWDKLASNLDDDPWKNLREFYKGDKVFKLMRQNGVFLYGYNDYLAEMRGDKATKESFLKQVEHEKYQCRESLE